MRLILVFLAAAIPLLFHGNNVDAASCLSSSAPVTLANEPDTDLVLDDTCTFPANTEYTYKSIVVTASARVTLEDAVVLSSATSILVNAGAIIYVGTPTSQVNSNNVKLVANTTLTIYGTLDGEGRGYQNHIADGIPRRAGGSCQGFGGSHGGAGGGENSDLSQYGFFKYPLTRGSGGDNGAGAGGRGGAAVHLKAKGKITIGNRQKRSDGTNDDTGSDDTGIRIKMDGSSGSGGYDYCYHRSYYYGGCSYCRRGGGGGGAGGSILIEGDSVEITGRLTANGGKGAIGTSGNYNAQYAKCSGCEGEYYGEGYCGGGGRIAILCTKKWDQVSPTSKNWNALDMFGPEPESVGTSTSWRQSLSVGGPGTVYYDCGSRR